MRRSKPTFFILPVIIGLANFACAGQSDFAKDVYPVLKQNCLACHSASKKKGELDLESPEAMRKGGENGPAVIPGKGADSLLIKVVSGKHDEIFMPPKKNKVGAQPLSAQEVAVIRQWIDEGATGQAPGSAPPINWQPLPPGLIPIYSVALSPDGQYAACGRANQVFLYHIPTGRLATRLTDPALVENDKPGVADRDMIQSLAFSPDGTLLATGGYRSIKLWRKQPPAPEATIETPAAAQALSCSPDGKSFAIGCADGRILLCESATGKTLRELKGHAAAVGGVRFSPDGARLCSGSTDKTVRVWDAVTGDLAAKAEAPAAVHAVVWAAAGKQVVSGHADGLIRVWRLPDPGGSDAAALALIKETKRHTGAVTALDVLPSGTQVLTGSADGSAQIINVEDGQSTRKLDHGGPVTAVAVRADGKRIATAGSNNVAKLWNDKGEAAATLKGDRVALEALVTAERNAAFARDEAAYFKTTLQNTEKQQKSDAETAKKAADAKAGTDKALTEKQQAAAKAREAQQAADKTFAEPLAAIRKSTEAKAAAEKAAATAASDAKAARQKATQAKAALTKATEAKEAADKALAALGKKAKAAELKAATDKAAAARTAADQAAAALKPADEAAAAAETKAKAANDAKTAADKAHADTTAKHAEAETKFRSAEKAATEAAQALQQAENAKTAVEHNVERTAGVLAKSEKALAAAKVAFDAADSAQKQADAALEAAKKAAAESEKLIRALSFSPDNRLLATGGEDGKIQTWNADNGRGGEQFKAGAAVVALSFCSENRIIVGQIGNLPHGVIIWNTNPEWKLERRIGSDDESSPLTGRVLALDFSPDGKLLASGGGIPSRGGELKIWSFADGALAREFKDAHTDTVGGVNFSADGKLLASGGADKLVKIFDLGSGKQVKLFEGHTHHVLGVGWRRDGRALASCGADKSVKVWDLITGEKKKDIEGFKKEVTSIHYLNSRGEVLVSAGDAQVKISKDEGKDNTTVRNFSGAKDYMYSAAVTPDGKLVAAGGQDSVLRIWDGANGQSILTLEPPK